MVSSLTTGPSIQYACLVRCRSIDDSIQLHATAFSPLEVSSDERHDDRGGARRSEGLTQRKTLSISKSGTIQIDGFEIRRSGLLATPLKDPRGGGGSVDSGASEDGASADVGAVLSTQLADGGLLSVQDALVPLTVLGRGAGGTVWQAVHVPSLRVVAVKTIPVFEEGRRHQMVRELRALYANLVRACLDDWFGILRLNAAPRQKLIL